MGKMWRQHGTTVIATVITVTLLATGAALGPAGQAQAIEPVLTTSDTEWKDGLNHFVLTPSAAAHQVGGATHSGRSAAPGEIPAGAVRTSMPDGRPAVVLTDGRLVALEDLGRPKPAPEVKADQPLAALTGGADGRAQSERFADLVRDWPGVETVNPMNGGLVAVATSLDRSAFESRAEVARVDVDALLQINSLVNGNPNDALFAEQWMHDNTGASSQTQGSAGIADADIDAPAAWARATGAGVVVADIDSGVDVSHPDLVDNVWRNAAENCTNGADDDSNGFIDDCLGWDPADNDNDPRPTGTGSVRAHGTHVGGLIGAAGDNDIGVVGTAPETKVMVLKISSGNSLLTSANIDATPRGRHRSVATTTTSSRSVLRRTVTPGHRSAISDSSRSMSLPPGGSCCRPCPVATRACPAPPWLLPSLPASPPRCKNAFRPSPQLRSRRTCAPRSTRCRPLPVSPRRADESTRPLRSAPHRIRSRRTSEVGTSFGRMKPSTPASTYNCTTTKS